MTVDEWDLAERPNRYFHTFKCHKTQFGFLFTVYEYDRKGIYIHSYLLCQFIVLYIAWLKRYKWKNHFYEMKRDVGMSLHEKERNKNMCTPRHKVTHNPIPTSLFCFNMLFVCLL